MTQEEMLHSTKIRIAKIVAAVGVAAIAAIGAASGNATAAPAATLYTETSLNQGKSLASNLTGFVVAAPPNASDGKQKWEAPFRVITLPNGQTAAGWQLKNAVTHLCVTDVGADLRVQELTCETAPGSNTKQVWQTVGGKSVNGKFYWFWENATTHRRLKVNPVITDGTFPTFEVTASTNSGNDGTALQNLHLWNEQVVS
jgi:hypothetical protein